MKYLHPDNADKPWMDWRLPENRRHMFFRWLQWRVRWSDLDHYAVTGTYLKGQGAMSPTGISATQEQRYWMALLFGMTYQSSMAWTIYWNFPDPWKIDLDELQKWNVENLDRQKYARDTKYNKGRITEQVKSVLRVVEPYGSIAKYFEQFVDSDENASFHRCFQGILPFYKFGRMSAWLTCQNLFELCNLPIRPSTVLATDPSNWSVRSGIMYLLGRSDLVEANDHELKLTASDLEMVHKAELDLYEESLDWIDADKRYIWSNYLLESHLCQYKKLLTGGDYGGHSSGDHVSRAQWLKAKWPEVNFASFFDVAVELHHPLVKMKRESKALRKLCMLTGQVINMHEDYDDLPDMYKEMSLDSRLLTDPNNDHLVASCISRYVEAQQGDFFSGLELLGSYG